MKLYEDGYLLKDNEYLLKVKPVSKYRTINTGFLTKLTQKGEIPVAFNRWVSDDYQKLPIYVFEETYRKGWALLGWRIGMSQSWAVLIHPEGFTVEIYLDQFLEIIQKNTIINGEIIGEFRWENNKLIQK